MHIALDAREAYGIPRTGKGQWARGFIRELMSRGIPLTLFADAVSTDRLPVASHVTLQSIPQTGIRWHLRVARMVKQERNFDFYVSPTSYIVPALLGEAKRCIPIVHDLIAFRSEPHDRRATLIERLTLGRTLRSACHICTVSESTKIDLLKQYPSLDPASITPIFAGPLRESPTLTVPDGKTILCVATLCPRKNQLRLIEAFFMLPNDIRAKHRLLLVGSRGWLDAEIIRMAQFTPGVEWRPYVPDEEYEKLLSTCTVFALPSLYEGFGMQILDALQRGIPVLTSDRGSLREVTGDAALYCDSENVTSIANSLERLLQDASLRQRLMQAGPRQAEKFSWKRTVDLFLNVVRG